MTQPRAFGAFSGSEYGAFTRGGRQVGPLTTGRTFGAHAGRRYGDFTGKRSGRPVGVLTQWHAYGTGGRYGVFARAPSAPGPAPAPSPHGGIPGKPYRLAIPEHLRRLQLDDDDVVFAVIAATIQAGLLEPQ